MIFDSDFTKKSVSQTVKEKFHYTNERFEKLGVYKGANSLGEGKSSNGVILRKFLIFWKFEPRRCDSYALNITK